jgi:hypothetical protein
MKINLVKFKKKKKKTCQVLLFILNYLISFYRYLSI